MRSHLTRLVSAAVALVLAGALASCGSDKAEPTTPSTIATSSTAADELPPQAELEGFVAAIASYDPGQLERALGSTQPGSVAAEYTGYLLALSKAAIDGGDPVPGAQISPAANGGYTACNGGGGPNDCVVWSDFQGSGGKLVDFTVNGDELDPRIAAGDGSELSAGGLGNVTVEYAYQSVQSQDLFVVVRVAAIADVTILSDRATYQPTDAAELASSRYVGPTGAAAGDTVDVVLVFPQVAIGGVAHLSLVGPGQHKESVSLPTS